MKKYLAVMALPVVLMGCTTSTYVKLPQDSVLTIKRDAQLTYREGYIKRAPLNWSSAGGVPYQIEKNGVVINEGRMRVKFRPESIFWPPAGAIYWPMGFRFGCNDLTGETPVECSASTFEELKSKHKSK